MRKWRGMMWALVIVWMVMCTMAAYAGVQLIGPADWQYRELDALSRAGMLSGHPKGPLSAWAEELTRYEAASLTLRAVEGLGKAYEKQGQALQQIAQGTGEGAAERSDRTEAETSAPRPPAGATMEDVARLEKLIEEFRAELVTMGVRADDLASALKDMQARLAKVEAERRRHQVDGYLQVRFRDDNADEGKQEFLVRRARVNLRGPVSERTSYRIELQLDSKEGSKGPGSKAQLRTAYIDYQLAEHTRLRVGQAKIPWGYELLESSSELWAAERALFMDRLFPEQRDIGVQVSCRRSSVAPQIDIGVLNGTGINASDNNDRKNLMARVNLPVRGGEMAVSAYAGTNEEGAAATRQDRRGLSGRCHWGEAQFMGEFVTGNDRGHRVRGWYGQLGHPVRRGKPNLLFAKYDSYDENRSLPGDLFTRWSLGYWCEIDRATRLTLLWELRDVEPLLSRSELPRWNGNAAYAQLQVKF